MNIKKAIGLGALTLWSLIAPALAKAEPKYDAVFSFQDRPANNFTLRGYRLGVYDDDTFLGAEQQQTNNNGVESTNNYFGARVPIKIGDDKLVADVMASDEQTQNSLGARVRYYYTEDDSIGPVVESLTTAEGNSTLAGFQADFKDNKTRFQLGAYQLNTPEGIEYLAHSTLLFSAANNLFGFGFRYKEDSQLYVASAQNETGDLGYRLRFRYDTNNIATQELVLASNPLPPGNMYGPINLRGQPILPVDIIPEYPNAPVKVAGLYEWFLPFFYTKEAGIEVVHTEDKNNNTELLKLDSVIYPFASTDGPAKGLLFGATWNQSRTGNETSSSTTFGVGYDYKDFRFVVQQEEGSKGETRGYVMWSQQF